MKKPIALLLAIVLCAGLTAPVLAAASAFADVPTTHWSYPYVERAYNAGIMLGTYYDAQSGRRLFSPNSDISCAEWSVILARSFYADEVAIEPDDGSWYSRQVTVMQNHKAYEGLGDYSLLKPLTRYQMAQMILNLLKAQNVTMPTEEQLVTTDATITDLASVPGQYKQAVRSCYYLGIIMGVGDGSFAGTLPMSRAQAATVWARLVDKIDELAKTQYGSAVGTISSEKVTLSLETHHWVNDYWSMQPQEIRELVDQDAFNCLIQTRIDTHKIQNEGEWCTESGAYLGATKSGINSYYNYAVFSPDIYSETQRNVELATAVMSDAGGFYERYQLAGRDYGYYSIRPFGSGTTYDQYQEVFAPILAKLKPGMSDEEKIKICVQAVCDRIDYEDNGSATWLNDKKTGDCGNYQTMTSQILSAAGYPVIRTSATLNNGVGHAWLQVLVNGEWMIVDGTSSEVGRGYLFTAEQHAQMRGYDKTENDYKTYKIAKAILEYPIAD